MAEGFQVDPAALHAAAEGVRDTVEKVTADPVAPVGAAAGHDGLGRTVDDFVARWRRGVQALAGDGRAVADHLVAAENAYRAVESSVARGADGILRASTGPDPAAR